MQKFLLWVIVLIFIISCSANDRLISAADKGDLAAVKALVDGGANLNYWNDGKMPLEEAAKGGHYEVVKYLLEKGASPAYKHHNGRTALMEAVASHHPPIVSLLIQNGADLNAKSDLAETPLSIAKKKKYDDIIAILKDAGVNLEKGSSSHTEKVSKEKALKRAHDSYKKYMESRKR